MGTLIIEYRFYFLLILIATTGCNMSDSSENLSNGYQFAHESETYNMIVGTHVIPCNVVNYRYDDHFIVAVQDPRADCPVHGDYKYKQGEQFYFWVIDNANDSCYGAMTRTEYKARIALLKIPTTLRVEEGE
jgi:hypothetical protein